MDTKNLLPIGTVVQLKEAKKKLMIIGIKTRGEADGELRDYISVLYPEGYLNRDVFFTFNHEAIDKILFSGYETEERTEFLKRAAAAIEGKEE